MVVTWLLLTVVSLSVLWIPPEHTLTKCVLGEPCIYLSFAFCMSLVSLEFKNYIWNFNFLFSRFPCITENCKNTCCVEPVLYKYETRPTYCNN